MLAHRLAPIEIALTNKPERIGEIVEGRAKLLDGQQQLVSREPALAVFDRGYGLAVPEAQQGRDLVLREVLFLPKRL
jgi:hypothetical protein